MGSSYYGEPSLGNGRSGSSSSRKGKKSSSSDKPKQPQRGLGVAQLEKIRLHNQMSCSFVPSLHTPYQTHINQEQDVRMEVPAYLPVPSSSSFSYSSSATTTFGFPPNIMMSMGDTESRPITYGDSQSRTTPTRWNYNTGIIETQYTRQPTITRPLLNLQMEDSMQKKRRKDRSNSMGSGSQNSDSSGTQEIDLDLKLSL
ncbi:hypothetical protein ACHQM5_002122 [Ranunculus cassubicifolius]